MARIATYVFLDLETTSIPSKEHNKTRITELSMVVVKRRHIGDTRAGLLPRVQHKLTMCFNPGRMIDPGATEASGLDNYLLEYETMFNIDVYDSINSFLKCQEKPVCLIAENGLTFDFPILKNHFEKLNVSLDDDILCADSLHAFYDILELSAGVSAGESYVQLGQANCSSASTSSSKTEAVNFKSDSKVIINSAEEMPSLTTFKEESFDNNNKDIELNGPLTMQQQNERTPKTSKLKIESVKKFSQVKRKIFFGGNAKPDKSYKLKNIYERINVLQRPGIEAHRAENDCIMTIEVAVAKAQQFMQWIDENHCPFSEVKAMKLGVPLGE